MLRIIIPLLITLWACTNTDKPGLYRDSILFEFNGNLTSGDLSFEGPDNTFIEGIDGQALSINQDGGFDNLRLAGMNWEATEDFSIQFWVKTKSQNSIVLASNKGFINKDLIAQKYKGWVLYASGGTLAWNIGSGEHRLTYERENGDYLPINDGDWHQVTMTYSKSFSEMRLYYDGRNIAIYKVRFDFKNDNSLVLGTLKNDFDYETSILTDIEKGALQLQLLVDEFNSLSPSKVANEEFLTLIAEPDLLLMKKLGIQGSSTQLAKERLEKVNNIRTQLLESPYTVHQILEFTEIKPLNRIYSLIDGEVIINQSVARQFTQNVRLYPSDFAMDNLAIWTNTLTAKEILNSYMHYISDLKVLEEAEKQTLTVGVWNIWHGGTHSTVKEHGWDSRVRIAEILREKNVDVILMQETYSSGDFIAAELGYYFATTSDRDYRLQGSNISVLSRYPIIDLVVPERAEFNNIGVKLALSETQEIYAMSNWYGMSNFPLVYDFHKERFDQSDSIPTLFGGDFNAVPHTDGGESMASEKLLANGFTDAYRSLHPDVKNDSAYTHNSGVRIDQLYYKGKGLINTTSNVISSWPGGFPSDHYLIISEFELN